MIDLISPLPSVLTSHGPLISNLFSSFILDDDNIYEPYILFSVPLCPHTFSEHLLCKISEEM